MGVLKSSIFILYFCVVNVITALDCSSSPLDVDELPAKNLAYALSNVSCPVNSGANQLIYYKNVSSILEYSNDIVETLSDTITWLSAHAPNGSVNSGGSVFIEGPLSEIPYEFGEWTTELVLYKQDIFNAKLVEPLLSSLMQQKAGLKNFINLVLATVTNDFMGDVNNILAPALGQLDCAINVFNSQSAVTACTGIGAPTTTASTVTSVLSLFSATSTTATGTGTMSTITSNSVSQSSSTTTTGTSPTSTHAGANSNGFATELSLIGLLVACGIF